MVYDPPESPNILVIYSVSHEVHKDLVMNFVPPIYVFIWKAFKTESNDRKYPMQQDFFFVFKPLSGMNQARCTPRLPEKNKRSKKKKK